MYTHNSFQLQGVHTSLDCNACHSSGYPGQYAGTSEDELILREGIVVRASRLAGRDVSYLRARTGGTVALVGVARQGKTLKNRLRRTKFLVGDVLLLQGDEENLEQQLLNLRLLPLAPRELGIVKPQRALLAMGIFAFGVIRHITVWEKGSKLQPCQFSWHGLSRSRSPEQSGADSQAKE